MNAEVELREGVAVHDAHGKEVGVSVAAAKQTVSRAVLLHGVVAGVRDASASRGHAGFRGTAVDEARTAHGLANGFGADPWMWVRRHPTGFSVRAACGTARLEQPEPELARQREGEVLYSSRELY